MSFRRRAVSLGPQATGACGALQRRVKDNDSFGHKGGNGTKKRTETSEHTGAMAGMG